MLTYKAERLGVKIVEADTFYPSPVRRARLVGQQTKTCHYRIGRTIAAIVGIPKTETLTLR